MRSSIIQYSDFLKSAAMYPAFCNSKCHDCIESIEIVCKKELATILAHIIEDTNANQADSEYLRFE